MVICAAGCSSDAYVQEAVDEHAVEEVPAVQEAIPVEQTATELGGQESAAMEQTTTEPDASDFLQKVHGGEYQTIRLVGDSITVGFGADGYEDPELSGTGRIIYDDGMGLVLHEPSTSANSWANAFRAWATENGVRDFANAGINGWFMHQLAENPDAWLAEGADVIVVALGTNDAGYYGPDQFRQDAEVALDAAAQRSKLVVVLSPVCDLRPLELLVEPAAVLGDVLQQLCAERSYTFVDTRDAVGPEMFCADGLHPNTEGSLAIWECIRATLGI